MTFETFVSKLVKAVNEIEKRGRGVQNADIVENIWQRVSNTELGQYLAALKVQFQHQPQNYREVLQDIASQVPSIGVDTFQKASKVLFQVTESVGDPYQGIYDSNGFIFHGTYLEKKWFNDSVKPHWEDIRRYSDAANRNASISLPSRYSFNTNPTIIGRSCKILQVRCRP